MQLEKIGLAEEEDKMAINGKKPDYNVLSYPDKKHPIQIGVAWVSEIGNITVKLNALPLTDELVLVKPTEKQMIDLIKSI